jgi:hypothetical protein
MRKPALIRALYAELRQMLGDEVSSSDVLKIANKFLQAYTDPLDETSDYGVPTDSRSFHSLPVDEAMRDGGWRIMSFEERKTSNWLDTSEPLDIARLDPIIEKYIGPEWRLKDWLRYGFQNK